MSSKFRAIKYLPTLKKIKTGHNHFYLQPSSAMCQTALPTPGGQGSPAGLQAAQAALPPATRPNARDVLALL